MNWVEILWIAMSAASLTLGIIHLFVWLRQRSQYAHLLFFALAISATAFGAFELAMMRAQSPAIHAATLRWAQVPLTMVVLSIVWFVHFYFGTGRLPLAWAISGLRLLGLGLNFVTGVNVNFREVSSLDQIMLWGGAVVAGPAGVANPWVLVPQITNLLRIVYVVDASIALWRRGGTVAHRRAAVVGGSLVLCITAVAGLAVLIITGLVHSPSIVMPGVFIVVLAMGYELGWDMLAVAQLAATLPSEQRFRVQARIDPLTGFVNRRGMEEIVARETARERRTKTAISLAIPDIDHFKRVNDEHGHEVGGQALIHLATLAKSALRDTDVVCRYGGEEFVVILPGSGVPGAQMVVDRLRVKVENAPLPIASGGLRIRFSAGVAESSGDEDRDTLRKQADGALYAAKRAGRNRVFAAHAAAAA